MHRPPCLSALAAAIAAVLVLPAHAASPNLAPATAAASPRLATVASLSRLIRTKLKYVGEGAASTNVPALTRTAMPGLTTFILCPGTSMCYLEATIEAQVSNATGAMGFDLIVDGIGTDPQIGANHVFNPENYEMTSRTFVVPLIPGRHRVGFQVFGTTDFSYVRHSASYRLFKP